MLFYLWRANKVSFTKVYMRLVAIFIFVKIVPELKRFESYINLVVSNTFLEIWGFAINLNNIVTKF